MNFKKYHVSRNLLSEKYENRSINGVGAFTIDNNYDLWLGEVVAGQTYTISNMDYVYGFFTTKPMSNTGTTYDGSRGYEMSGTAVATVPSGCTWIAVRVLHNADNAMLNTGSTPLPYEPYSSEVWHDTPHYIHNTSEDTITSLPAVLYPTDTTATVGLKGNTLQSSVPSPDSPVMPNGTGERTGNLVDVSNSNCIIYSTYNQFTITNDIINITGNALFGFIVKCSPNTQYTVSSARTGYNCDMRIREYSEKPSDWTNDFITQSVNVSSAAESASFTTNSATKYILVCFYGTNTSKISNIMLNTGSTPLPHENFGYKIPILSGGTTTTKYLGQVETTRKIKKYEFTGQENWELHSTQANLFRLLNFDGYLFELKNILVCNTYKSVVNGGAADIGDKQTGFYFSSGAVSRILYIRDSSYSTVSDFKTYLQQQYAAGTPVCVWYVLATEETAVVNEPLMKIGDYADTLSNVSIPVTAGGDTLSVGTTVQPSEVTVNYKGWHPVTDVHERESGQWD